MNRPSGHGPVAAGGPRDGSPRTGPGRNGEANAPGTARPPSR